MNIQAVGIVRQRGQLTIPNSIRKNVDWVTSMSAITISVVKADEIVIKPTRTQINWDKMWELIRKSRAIKGKNAISAVEILEKDRQSH